MYCDQLTLILCIPGWFNNQQSTNVIHYINKLMKKYHMIILTDVEKAIDKIQHAFKIKLLHKVGIKGTFST